jgi:DNA-binding transcriptional MerR regulator
MAVIPDQPKNFLSHNELAQKFKIHPVTLTHWLEKIKGLNRQSGQRIYSPDQLKKIFDHLGNPM